MFNNVPYALGMGAPLWLPVAGFGLLVVVLWSIVWKGLALWHSAQRGHHWWFLALLVLNTAGILEIIYLFFILKIKPADLLTNNVHTHDHQ